MGVQAIQGSREMKGMEFRCIAKGMSKKDAYASYPDSACLFCILATSTCWSTLVTVLSLKDIFVLQSSFNSKSSKLVCSSAVQSLIQVETGFIAETSGSNPRLL